MMGDMQLVSDKCCIESCNCTKFVISADCVNTSFSVDNWQQKVLDSAVFNRVGISSINTPLMLSQI